MTDWKPIKMVIPDPYPHLTESERSADARTLRRLLEEARGKLLAFDEQIDQDDQYTQKE